MSDQPSDDTERLIQQVKGELYDADDPVSLQWLIHNTDADSRREMKTALRRMIDCGMIGTAPRLKYCLSANTRRSMDTDTDQSEEDTDA